jgi:hypothetical protein
MSRFNALCLWGLREMAEAVGPSSVRRDFEEGGPSEHEDVVSKLSAKNSPLVRFLLFEVLVVNPCGGSSGES